MSRAAASTRPLASTYFKNFSSNYRAMHVVQSAVLLSYVVRLSVSSQVITRVISLGSSLFGAPTNIGDLSKEIPKIRMRPEYGWGAIFSRKPIISLKWGEIWPTLLLMTIDDHNRKSHYALSISTEINYLWWPWPAIHTLFQNTWVFGAHHENLNEDKPPPSAVKI